MKALSLTVVIQVSNLEASVKYYTEVLGFTLDFTFGDYAGLFYNEAAIHLSGPTLDGIKKPVGSALFSIDCDEIDNYFEEIKARGAIILGPPADRYYGVRDCAINDLDGNTIVFGKAI